MAGKLRFEAGPGSDLRPVADAYVAAIAMGDQPEIDRLRQEIYRVTGPYIEAAHRKGPYRRQRGQARGR